MAPLSSRGEGEKVAVITRNQIDQKDDKITDKPKGNQAVFLMSLLYAYNVKTLLPKPLSQA